MGENMLCQMSQMRGEQSKQVCVCVCVCVSRCTLEDMLSSTQPPLCALHIKKKVHLRGVHAAAVYMMQQAHACTHFQHCNGNAPWHHRLKR